MISKTDSRGSTWVELGELKKFAAGLPGPLMTAEDEGGWGILVSFPTELGVRQHYHVAGVPVYLPVAQLLDPEGKIIEVDALPECEAYPDTFMVSERIASTIAILLANGVVSTKLAEDCTDATADVTWRMWSADGSALVDFAMPYDGHLERIKCFRGEPYRRGLWLKLSETFMLGDYPSLSELWCRRGLTIDHLPIVATPPDTVIPNHRGKKVTVIALDRFDRQTIRAVTDLARSVYGWAKACLILSETTNPVGRVERSAELIWLLDDEFLPTAMAEAIEFQELQ
jgi:hypothetical protein